MRRAICGADHSFGGETQRTAGRTEHERTGRVASHLRGNGVSAAQRVIDEIADGGPVAGAGEAAGLGPVGESLGRRAVTGEDVVQHLGGRADARAWPHG